MTAKRFYGWRKDKVDPRDLRRVPPRSSAPLPQQVDLRNSGNMPPVYDQGQLGSCTANAIAAAVDFERKKQGLDFVTPSRLFIYYNERVLIEGSDAAEDGGAQIRDGIKSVAQQGVCPESEWPYNPNLFSTKPADLCYADALQDLTIRYQRLAPPDLMAILAGGSPVVFGFTVFDSFESDAVASSGIVPMPATGENDTGGHAVLCVGYDQAKQMFLVRNSWGASWGQGGYFWMPFAYVNSPDWTSDFWTIEAVS